MSQAETTVKKHLWIVHVEIKVRTGIPPLNWGGGGGVSRRRTNHIKSLRRTLFVMTKHAICEFSG